MSATTTTNDTEQQLVAAMQSGNMEALQGLYRKYAPMLLGFIVRLVDEKTAGEVLQKAFMEIWARRAEYNEKTQRLFTWMLKITRRQVQSDDGLKQNITRYEIRNSNISVNMEGVLKKTPMQDIADSGNDLQEAVFTLMYINGCNVSEVAEKTQTNANDVKKMLRCAMNKFKVVQHG